MPRRIYDLNGVVLEVESAEDALAGYLGPILAPLEVASAVPDCRVTVSTVPAVASPADMRCIWEGRLPEGIPAASWERDGRQVLVAPEHYAIDHESSSRTWTVSVTATGRKAIAGTAVFWLLDRVLAACDRHLLHGACLIRRDPARAIALFAPSGTGKTTTALALAHAGLGLAGDDALILENAAEGSFLWAVPRRFNVHRRTAALLPWLAPLLPPWTADEQGVAPDTLKGVIDLPGPIRCPAGGAIVLMKPNPSGHRIEAIAKPEALSYIVGDNVHRAPTGVLADGQATFAAIARFIARTPVVALSVGPDPGTLTAAMVLSALDAVSRGRAAG